MKAWHPEIKEAVRFLRIVSDPERTPVLGGCQRIAEGVIPAKAGIYNYLKTLDYLISENSIGIGKAGNDRKS